jgi:hypothetical protein
MIEEIDEGDEYKIEGFSGNNKMKRKTRNNQNNRDVMNEPFLLSSTYLSSLYTPLSLI